MTKPILRLAIVAATSMFCAAASASSFTYTFTSPAGAPQFDATLTFTATSIGSGTYDITEVSGSIASGDVTASSFSVPTLPCNATSSSTLCNVPNPAIGGSIGYDNLLYPGAVPIIDNAGLAFTLGGVTFNLFYLPGTYQWLDTDNFPNLSNYSNPIYVTPEPSSIVLLGMGAALAAVWARRRILA